MSASRFADAEKIARTLLSRQPGYPKAAYSLAHLATTVGAFEESADILRRSIELYKDLAKRYDEGTLDRESPAKVKIETSRRASDLITLAMEVCGGVACLDEFGLMRHLRDVFVCRVGEGSNYALKTLATRCLMPEIQRVMQ